MEQHLDYMSHPNDWPKVFPEVGTIKGVRAKDYSTNITGGAFTTYDVTVHFQAGYGCQNIDLQHVPPAGQFAGGAIEVEFDYVVDQKVIVGFLGGDVNRPYIQCPYLDLDAENARTTAQYPRIRILANGAEILVDKDGNISLVPKSGEELTLAGLVGDAALKKLIHEDFFGDLANAFTSAAVTANDGGATLKGAMATYLNLAATKTDNSTSITKAK